MLFDIEFGRFEEPKLMDKLRYEDLKLPQIGRNELATAIIIIYKR